MFAEKTTDGASAAKRSSGLRKFKSLNNNQLQDVEK